MRNKILSLLALLLTAVTGAWAQWTGGTYTATESELNWNSVNVTDDATLTINQDVEVTRGSITISAGKTLTVVGPGQLQVRGAITGSGTIIVKGNASLLVYGADGSYGAPGFNGSDGGDGAAAIMCSITIYSGSIRAYGGAGGDGGEGDEDSGTGGDGGDGAPAFAGSGTLTYYGGSIEAFGGSSGSGGDGHHYGNGGAEAIAFADTYNVVFENQPTSIQDAYNNPIDINNIKGVWYFKILGDDNEPEPPLEVDWNATTKTGTFTMPGSDVVLTPRYAAATLYQNDGETEKQAYETLKEAIQNVQDGDVIKLDWDVTFTEKDDPIETSDEGEGVTFTLDLNGHTIDGIALEDPCIVLNNANDQMTITDSKLTGGVKGIPATGAGAIIFDGGRYYLGSEVDAENIKDEWDNYVSVGWQMAEGKEFVDLEGGALANDGFTLRVAYAAFELTIGPKRFATFYAAQNTTLDEGQNIGFYTISSISDDRTKANVARINSTIIPANTPTLVYNSGDDPVTAKLKVTTDAVNLTVDYVEQFKGDAKKHEFTADDMAAADYYALSGGKAFAPVYEPGTIVRNKCWLQFPKQQTPGARTIRLVFDDATAISAVSGSPADTGDIYDLQGRKVQKPARKGVYVKDGRKVVR